jgi:hypothetical protein
MRGKDFNTGLRGVLFEARHYERMGSAVWLYAWLVLRQTHQSGSTGWVLGGAPVSYKEIEEETGFNVRTLERWMSTLRRHGYIETEPAIGGLIVRITKAKKHTQTARNFSKSGATETLRKAADGIRRVAGEPRRFADEAPQNCVAERRNSPENREVWRAICSSSLEKSLERSIDAVPTRESRKSHNPANFDLETHAEVENHQRTQPQNPSPSCQGERQNQNLTSSADLIHDPFAGSGRSPRPRVQPPQKPWISRDEVRLQLELLRAEREDAVRRELCVGRGPEIHRPARETTPASQEVKLP